MTVLTLQPADLRAAKDEGAARRGERVLAFTEFRSDADRELAKGRVSVYERPRFGRDYTLGFDTAKGIAGRDLSAVSIFDKTCQREGDGRARQVCEAAGHWGGESFDRLVYALFRWYCGPLIMGEAQDQGLAVLRRLVNDYEVRHLYYDKSQGSLAAIAANNPRLGWNRAANDITLTNFVKQVRDRKVVIRSAQLIEQMSRFKWKPRSKQAEKDERVGDDKLVAKLDGGGSPDLIMAALYAVYALDEVHRFVAEKPKPQPLPFYGPPVPEALQKALNMMPEDDMRPKWVGGMK